MSQSPCRDRCPAASPDHCGALLAIVGHWAHALEDMDAPEALRFLQRLPPMNMTAVCSPDRWPTLLVPGPLAHVCRTRFR